MKNITKVLALTLVAISLLAIAAPALAVTTGTYNYPAVNLRSTVGGSSMGLVNQGATCNILEASTDSSGRAWYKVTITSHTTNGDDLYGKTGWSWQQYITVTGGTTPSTHPQKITEAFGTAYLQQGSSGNYVRNLQYCLHQELLLSFNQIDGDFGPNTYSAVLAYQRKYDDVLSVDGIVGPNTKDHMWGKYWNLLMTTGYK